MDLIKIFFFVYWPHSIGRFISRLHNFIKPDRIRLRKRRDLR